MSPSISNSKHNKPTSIFTMNGTQVLHPSTSNRTTATATVVAPPALHKIGSFNNISPLLDCDLIKNATNKPLMIKSKSFNAARVAPVMNLTDYNSSMSLNTSLTLESPTSKLEKRKLRIGHYGRVPKTNSVNVYTVEVPQAVQSEKRCTFITPNSDPILVTYHDQEWGVPVHDDRLLFELLVLTCAQVGSDLTSILKKRRAFKDAFAGFDPHVVSKFEEKQMLFVSVMCGMDLSKVRGVVDNAARILEVEREFGSLDKYLWGFVNNKPIITNYKTSNKIPVKTSKSDSISKDMMKRGFRAVGPTVIHSFTQAAGLTNDHLVSCRCRAKCAPTT